MQTYTMEQIKEAIHDFYQVEWETSNHWYDLFLTDWAWIEKELEKKPSHYSLEIDHCPYCERYIGE